MNILLINHYAGSHAYGMEYRPYYLGREWVKLGHEVTVLAATHSHLRTSTPPIRGEFTPEEIDGIHYVWVKTPPYQGNGVRRLLNMLTFVGRLSRRCAALADQYRPDLVVASSTYPLDIFPAHRIARKSGARLVYEVHDLWPLTLIELGRMSKWNPLVVLLQWAENFAYRKSDYVVSLLPNTLEHMRAHGMAEEKLRYIPNGIVTADWSAALEPMPREHAETLAALKQGGNFLVAYAGAHGVANALDSFVTAGSMLRHERVAFLLVGQGPEKARLQRRARDLAASNVHFLPSVPKAAVPSLLAAMDVLYIGLADRPIYRFGVSPNKLMDYMMAAKPVIHAINAGTNLVEAAGCGLSIPPEQPQAIAAAVGKLMQMPPEDRAAMGQRGARYVMEHHDFTVLARRFLRAVGVRSPGGEDAVAEEARLRAAYSRRRRSGADEKYSPFNAANLFRAQEVERVLLRVLARSAPRALADARILEIGCGSGYWLRKFIEWGAQPEHLAGIDVLGDRVEAARRLCPAGVQIECGSAANLPWADASFDVVLLITLFSSILDDDLRQRAAAEGLRVLQPAGLILWYDFHVNNPWNPDVRAVKKNEIRRMFPGCVIEVKRVSLAPPLARRLVPYASVLAALLGRIPLLCTHYAGVIRKGTQTGETRA